MVVAIGAALGVGRYMYNEKPTQASEKAADVESTAATLFTAFSSDETAAGKLYNDKVVQVAGTIREISKETNGPTNILLETGDPLGAVVCEFTADQAPEWKKGMNVTVKGFCAGFNMDVLLQRCSAVE